MKDHFSNQASIYAKARPHYPPELFAWLSTLVKTHDLAWDCGTGNGQAAMGLLPYFKKIIATDGSQEQLKSAIPNENVTYRQATAENSGLPDHSADLITAATAAHWFDLPPFYKEAVRIGKPDGAIAVWTYGHSRVSTEMDKLYEEYTFGTLGNYWPKGREHIDTEYRELYFSFRELSHLDFYLRMEWTFHQYLDYLKTWSARQVYMKQTGNDPITFIEKKWPLTWGTGNRTVTWPIYLKAAKLSSYTG